MCLYAVAFAQHHRRFSLSELYQETFRKDTKFMRSFCTSLAADYINLIRRYGKDLGSARAENQHDELRELEQERELTTRLFHLKDVHHDSYHHDEDTSPYVDS